MLEIDHYAYQSRWREVNPLTKALAYIVLLLVALCSIWLVQLVILVVLALSLVMSRGLVLANTVNG